MKERVIVVGAFVMFALGVAYAANPDARLAKARKAFVIPVDDLRDDAPVAECFADHLKSATPIESVATREEADVVFRVRANIPTATKRVMVGAMGGSPSAHLYAELPDGMKLWNDGAKLRRAIGKFGRLANSDAAKGVECGLADELLDRLRDAMRKARDPR